MDSVGDGRHPDVEDIVQTAFVEAFRSLADFRGDALFSTWLTRIAINEALARARKQGRYEPLDEETREAGEIFMTRQQADPERQAFARELGTLLESAVDALPDGARETFVLREIEGLSTAETAECLGVSEDVIKTRLSRARASLRRELFERAGLAASNAFRFERPRCDRVVAAVMERIGG